MKLRREHRDFGALVGVLLVLILVNQWRKMAIVGTIAAVLLIALGVWGGNLFIEFYKSRKLPPDETP